MPFRKSKLRYLWYGWGAAFVIFECIGVITNDSGDMLSEVIWDYRNHMGSFGYASIAALLLWLFYHFLIEGPKK